MVFEGVIVMEQGSKWLNFNRDTEGKKIYNEAKRIWNHGSKKNYLKIIKKRSYDKRRNWKMKFSMKGFSV